MSASERLGSGPWRAGDGRLFEVDPEGLPPRWEDVEAVAVRVAGAPGLRGVLVAPPAEGAARAGFDAETAAFEAAGGGPAPALLGVLPGGGRVVAAPAGDLEAWWEGSLRDPGAVWALCAAMAEVAERLADFRVRAAAAGLAVEPLVEPRTVWRARDGRWLLARFLAPESERFRRSPFASPEARLGALRDRPERSWIFSLGAVLFALLVLRGRRAGGRTVPVGGAAELAARSRLFAEVDAVAARHPDRFTGRPLDPDPFLHPDRLPDEDRRAVMRALQGVFGAREDALEGRLARALLKFLDRAMALDPRVRMSDPREAAAELAELAARVRRLQRECAEARTPPPPPEDTATRIIERNRAAAPPPPPPPAPAAAPGAGPVPPGPSGEPAAAPPEEQDEVPTTMDDKPPGPLPRPPPPPEDTPTTVIPRAARPSAPVPRPPPAPEDTPTTVVPRAARPPAPPAPEPPATPGGRRVLLVAVVLLSALQLVELPLIGWLGWRALGAGGGRVPPVPAVGEGVAPAAMAAAPAPAPAEEVIAPAAPEGEGATGAGPSPGDVAPPVEAAAEEEVAAAEPAVAGEVAAAPASAASAARPALRRSRREAGRPQPAEAAAGAPGRLVVEGDGEARLQGEGGTFGPGEVPAGRYRLEVRPAGAGGWKDLGEVDVRPGEAVRVRCGFGTCRRR